MCAVIGRCPWSIGVHKYGFYCLIQHGAQATLFVFVCLVFSVKCIKKQSNFRGLHSVKDRENRLFMRHSSHHIPTSYVIYNWPRRIPTAYITWSSSRGTDPTRPLQTVRGLSSPTSTEKKKKYTRTNVKPRVLLKAGSRVWVSPYGTFSGTAAYHTIGSRNW